MDQPARSMGDAEGVEAKKDLVPKKGGLIVIDIPPPPEDICKICDPVMKTDLRIAIFTTIFCWFPLGVLPIIFGFISIHYALEAKKTDSAELRSRYSYISASISWIGMMLFVTVLTLGVVITATCGIL
ncbi:uncharacterized protein LOC120327242 [Styela clava]